MIKAEHFAAGSVSIRVVEHSYYDRFTPHRLESASSVPTSPEDAETIPVVKCGIYCFKRGKI